MKSSRKLFPLIARWSFFVTLALFLFGHNENAEAKKIKRSCTGEIKYNLFDLEGNALRKQGQIVGQNQVLERFNAVGGCGKKVPGRCRKRAQTALMDCAYTAWIQRYDGHVPRKCAEATSSVSNFLTEDLDNSLKVQVCCIFDHPSPLRSLDARFPDRNPATMVNLWIKTSGKKECSGKPRRRLIPRADTTKRLPTDLSNGLVLDCLALRIAGICERYDHIR
jgi:hypothetical protein